MYAKFLATAFRNHVVRSIRIGWRALSILCRVFSSSLRTIALLAFFMYVSVDGNYPIRAILIAVMGSTSWMYLDIHATNESGVRACWFEMVVRPGVDRIRIHAIITVDATELADKGEICGCHI